MRKLHSESHKKAQITPDVLVQHLFDRDEAAHQLAYRTGGGTGVSALPGAKEGVPMGMPWILVTTSPTLWGVESRVIA